MSTGTEEQLRMRALRLLHDGLPHDPAAVQWARVLVSPELTPGPSYELQRAGFSLREISLGAQ
jgi:hypothetical protein